jgi:hypothetical protein
MVPYNLMKRRSSLFDSGHGQSDAIKAKFFGDCCVASSKKKIYNIPQRIHCTC